jgi:hypothetical protein
MLPELPLEEGLQNNEQLEDDASEQLKRQQQLEEEMEALALRMRSGVLKNHLPRPVNIPQAFAGTLVVLRGQTILQISSPKILPIR